MNRRGTSLSHGVNRNFGSSSFSKRVTRSANSTAAQHPQGPQPSLAALMDSPARRDMPHLHPQKLNGGLWFDTDDCIDKDIKETWHADFWGQWWNYNMIPQNNKDAWWSSFVQNYYWDNQHHEAVFTCWKHLCQESIENVFHKRKRSAGKKLDYTWKREEMVKNSKTALENYTSYKDELGMHYDSAEDKNIDKIAHEMRVEAGEETPPSAHTQKIGLQMNKQARALVTTAETLPTQQSTSDESDGVSEIGSTATRSARHHLNVASEIGDQYHNVDPNMFPATSLRANLAMEIRMTMMEQMMQLLTQDFAELRQGINALLRVHGIDPTTLQPIGQGPPTTPAKDTISTADPTP